MGKPLRHDERLARLFMAASRTDGIFSVPDAAALGVSKSALGRMVSDGLLERVSSGHLRAAHLAWTLPARERQALLIVGPGASAITASCTARSHNTEMVGVGSSTVTS